MDVVRIGLLAFIVLLPVSAQSADNPFGVMAGGPGHRADAILNAIKQTGAAYVRPPEVMVDQWIASHGQCPDCAALRESGLKVILTVRNSGRNTIGKEKERVPSTPPRDLTAYKTAVAEILEAYRPAVLVVENEENAPPFFYDGTKPRVWDSPGDGIDTADAYAAELAAACDVAHARQVPCANGGLTSEATAATTWYHYLKTGRAKEACSFARRAFYTARGADIGSELCKITSVEKIAPKVRELIERVALRLLKIYGESPIDYVNLHWYIRDAGALREAAAYLHDATGKPVMTNEIGQWSWDAAASRVQPLMQAVLDAGMTYAVWFSVDAGQTKGLFNTDGTLRENGRAFQNFLMQLSSASPER